MFYALLQISASCLIPQLTPSSMIRFQETLFAGFLIQASLVISTASFLPPDFVFWFYQSCETRPIKPHQFANAYFCQQSSNKIGSISMEVKYGQDGMVR